MTTFRIVTLLGFIIAARITTAQEVTPLRSNTREALPRRLEDVRLGKQLYRECDIFRRIIDSRLAEDNRGDDMSFPSLQQQQPMGDTSLDITHNSADENETTVTISRTNPNLIVVGFNDGSQVSLALGMSACVSTDAGNSWTKLHLPKVNYHGTQAWCDPILTCDDSGMFYYAFLAASRDFSISDIFVGRSTDGKNWTLGSPVVGDTVKPTKLQDKPSIAVDRDPNSPYHGRLYVAWSEYPSIADTLWDGINYIAYSDDHGVSWSKPLVYSTAFGHFATLRVGKGGTVFISSNNFRDETVASFAVEVSHDGGNSFSEYPIAMRQKAYPIDHNVYMYAMLKGTKGFRADPYISFDLDPETNELYAVYGSYDTIEHAAHEFMVRSKDEAVTWSSPVRIGTPSLTDRDHCMPWVTYDPSTKQAYAVMYSSEEDSANMLMRRVRYSFDAPTKPEPFGTRLFDPTLASAGTGGRFASIGDYTYSDAFGGTFVDVWAENRPPTFKDCDVFAFVSSPATHSGVIRQVNAPALEVSELSPNPVRGDHLKFTLNAGHTTRASIRVFDDLGHAVLSTFADVPGSMITTVSLEIGHLPAGSYIIVIDGNEASISRRFVLVR
jgi:hypothetical protein